MTELSRTRTYEEPGRGRPKGKSNLFKSALKSIVLIAGKYDLDPKLLVEAFVEAWRSGMSLCGSLKINCRAVNQDSATLLITNEEKVVSQFPVKLEILRNPDSLKNYIQNIPMPNYSKRKFDQKPKKIGDLRFGMKGVNLKAKIIEIPPVKAVITRWGTQAFVSNVWIADETGSIRLSLWNNQIDNVHVGDEVEIENGYVASFAGEPQLRLGRKGVISVVNHSPYLYKM